VPEVIADNGATVTIRRDDGSTVVVAKSVYDQLGQPAGAMGGLLPPAVEGMAAGAVQPPPPMATGGVMGAVGAVDASAPLQGIVPQGAMQPTAAGAPPPVDIVSLPAPPSFERRGAPQIQGLDTLPPAELERAQQREQARAAAEADAAERRVPSLEDTTASIRQNVQVQQDARARLAGVDAAEAEQVAGALAAQDTEASQIEADQKASWEAAIASGKERQAKIDAAAEAYDNAEIEPGRLWHDMGTGRKVLAGIGLALSAIGQAKSGQGGVFQGLQVLQDAIANDINLQREAIQLKGAKLDKQRGALKDFWGVVDREQDAYNLALAASTKKVQRQISMYAAASGKDRVLANAEIVNAELQAQGDAALAQVEQSQYARAFQQAQLAQADAASRRSAWASTHNAKLADKRARDQMAHEREMATLSGQAKQAAALEQGTILDPNTGAPIGVSRFGKDNLKEAVKDQDTVNAYVGLRDKVSAYKAKLKEVGEIYQGPYKDAVWAKSQDAADLEALHISILSDYLKAQSGATATEDELKRLQKVVPGPKSLMQRADPSDTLDQWVSQQDAKVEKYLAGRGINVRDLTGQSTSASPAAGYKALDAAEPGAAETEQTAAQKKIEAPYTKAEKLAKKKDYDKFWTNYASSTKGFAALTLLDQEAAGDASATAILDQVVKDAKDDLLVDFIRLRRMGTWPGDSEGK
jgi:hypothetical protein